MSDERLLKLVGLALEIEAADVPAGTCMAPIVRRPALRRGRTFVVARRVVLLAAAACLAIVILRGPLVSRSPTLGPSWAGLGNHIGAAHTGAAKECMLCDADCDGVVDNADIGAFLLALANPEAYADQFPDCDVVCPNDLNCDGVVDDADIAPFVLNCLVGG